MLNIVTLTLGLVSALGVSAQTTLPAPWLRLRQSRSH